jgi:hypothetical protein
MMKRPVKRKAKTIDDCRRHFNKRWYQRVAINMDSQFDVLNKLIKQQVPNWFDFIEFAYKESNTRTHYRIKLSDKSYIVVYNNNVGSVTTIFPEHKED